MRNKLTPIVVKKESVSDNSYKIIELYFQNGSQVKKGELILCVETSKITIDIESPVDGYIFFDKIENKEVSVGQTIAVVTNNKKFSYEDWFQSIKKSKKEKKNPQNHTIKISKPAQRLIDQNNIDISEFEGLLMITKEDVENYIFNLHKDDNISDLIIDKNSIVIFGGGGHAKVCIDILKQTQTHAILGIVDDNTKLPKKILNIPVIGTTNTIEKLAKNGLKNVIIGIGGISIKSLKKKVFLSLKKRGLKIPTIIHPSASVEPSAIIGEGNQIMQGAIIGSNVKIGNNCIINSGSIISHDTVIGDNVHIAPGAILAGGVTIKNDTTIGMGCTIFLGLTIGENVVIQNGVHIFKNIKSNINVKKDF